MFSIVVTMFGVVFASLPCIECETMEQCNAEAQTFVKADVLESRNFCVEGEPLPEGQLNPEQWAVYTTYVEGLSVEE